MLKVRVRVMHTIIKVWMSLQRMNVCQCSSLSRVWCVPVVVCTGAAAGPVFQRAGREAEGPAREGGQTAAGLGAGAL